MFDLRKTLSTASQCLSDEGIAHALIGGFALAAFGINRATADIDFLADGERKLLIISSLEKRGFKLVQETKEVLHFEGTGFLDVLLANRPLSRQMIADAKPIKQFPVKVLLPEDVVGLKIQAYKNDPARELQDKADIQKIFHTCKDLNWARIKKYGDLFGEWQCLVSLGAPNDIR